MSDEREAEMMVIYPANTTDTRHWINKDGPVFKQTEFPGSELTRRDGGLSVVILMLDPDHNPVIGKRQVRRNQDLLTTEEGDLATFKEFNALSKFNHPNIVRVLGLGQGESEGLFVLEQYVEGESVEDWVKRPHGVSEIARLVQCVSDGVNHINEQGYIHKDLKLDAVRMETDGNWVIVDCGSVFNLKDKGKANVIIEASSNVMAPEEPSMDICLETDVYYSANFLFDILTYDPGIERHDLFKQLLFTRDIPFNTFYKQVFAKNPELAGRLSDIILKGVDGKFQERQANVVEFNQEVQSVFVDFMQYEKDSEQ